MHRPFTLILFVILILMGLPGLSLGVSADSHETNTKFADENGIAFPLVSDGDQSIKKAYGRGRVTVLIDKDGVIRFVQKGVPRNADFLDRLKQLGQ